MSAGYELIGLTLSPYSMKTRAVMRYRRIPFEWIRDMPQVSGRTLTVSPVLLPVLCHPMGRQMTDSTEIIEVLEREIVNDRRVTHPDPGIAFISDLLEDMADEWLTKIMFYMRWHDAAGARYAADAIAAEIGGGPAQRNMLSKTMHLRQTERMELVGATADNAPALNGSLKRIARALDTHLREEPFLTGRRPIAADFALYGQLSQLCFDPVPAALLRELAPQIGYWIRAMDDLSGIEAEWNAPDTALAQPVLLTLLEECAEVYLPFLVANAEAYGAGATTVTVETPDGPYSQRPFKYQVKCLDRLRQRYRDTYISGPTQALLDRSGCVKVLAG
ncbi:MAG: glutathione S-transferase N-terminal domain-containing protein [Pseudomonadota bacterium]